MSNSKIGKRIIGPNNEPFEIMEYIGGGSFGEVHKAVGESSAKVVAVKSIPLGVGAVGLKARAALNEARPEMTSIRHPNVVETLCVCDGVNSSIGPFLMTEYVDGGNLENFLQDFVNRNAEIPLQDALKLMQEIAIGAEAISLKLVHRDIKPDNILLQLTPDGVRPKIGDFGIAKIVEAATRQSSETFKGIAPIFYRAPETFIKNAPNTGKIDIYSVGIVFYEILTLTHPLIKFLTQNADITDWMHAHKAEIPDDPKLIRPETPSTVASLILRMMSKLPAQRPEWVEILSILGGTREPVKPRRISSSVQQLLEIKVNEIDQKKTEQMRKEIAERERREKVLFERDNAAVVVKQKLADFDDYMAELGDLRPDYPIKASSPSDFDRNWILPNQKCIRCSFWFPGEPIMTQRGRLIACGYVGVDGGFSFNLALMTDSEGTSYYWLSIRLDTHPLMLPEKRVKLIDELDLSPKTVEFIHVGGSKNWASGIPLRFGIPSGGVFLAHAAKIGRQESLDMSEVNIEIEKDFTTVVECGLKMP